MKRRFHLLALPFLFLAIITTGFGKASPKAILVCSQCGRECRAGQKFCAECGGKVVREEPPRMVCSECGKECPDGEKYCVECGGKVVTELPDSLDDLTITLPGKVKLEMKQIKAGSFLMGSPEDERGRYDDEVQHRVTLMRDYWLGTCEVTQAQWKAVMGSNPSEFKGDDLPVENVSWEDAMEFCKKLNHVPYIRKPKGYQFSLPTEAQWEYACRAGTTSALNSGRNLTSAEGACPNLDQVGWYWKNSGSSTHPVGRKQPNAWGLYDMHGNVWEWCRDWFGDYSGKATDPTGPSSGSYRVIRGGSWGGYAQYCRSAYRCRTSPGYWSIDLGFRLALVPVQE